MRGSEGYDRPSGAEAKGLAAEMTTVVLPEVFTGVVGTEQVTFVSALATEHVKVTGPLKFR